MSTARKIVDDDGARRADLAAIHMGKKALGWSDEEYRDLLWTVCSVRSAGDLDFAGRKRFLDHMRRCGFVGKPQGKLRGPQGKIWSLWQQLADAGRVRDRRMAALDLFVKGQLGVDKMVWLNAQQQDLLIARLKAFLKRDGGPNAA